jgi:hypothetical protein
MALLSRVARLACLAIALLMVATAGAAATLEYQVKAVFLLHFAQFVEWPEAAFVDARSPLNICILGEDPFGGVIDDTVRGEAVGDRHLQVQRLKSLDGMTACHILFISPSETARLRQDIAALRGQSVLTVGDGDDFSRTGGMIAFALVEDKVRLQINPEAARAANLKISSKLLQAAQIVGAGD